MSKWFFMAIGAMLSISALVLGHIIGAEIPETFFYPFTLFSFILVTYCIGKDFGTTS